MDLMMRRLMHNEPDDLDGPGYAQAQAELAYFFEAFEERIARGVCRGIAYAFGKGKKGG